MPCWCSLWWVFPSRTAPALVNPWFHFLQAGEGLRRLLAGSTESEGGGTSVCYGNSAMEIEPQTCSDGKAPLVSLTALHEVQWGKPCLEGWCCTVWLMA